MRDQPSDNRAHPSGAAAHERRVTALREHLGQQSTISGAAAVGTEEVILRFDGVAPAAGGAAARAELHLLLLAPDPIFWLTPPRRRPSAESGFAEWLWRRLEGARVTHVSSGQSGRILRIDLVCSAVVTGEAGRARTALILDPGPSACRLLVLGTEGHEPVARIEQRYPPTVRARAHGRGSPGTSYEEPPPGSRDSSLPLPPGAGETGPAASAQAGSGRDPAPPDAARSAGELWIRYARHREAARGLRMLLRAEERRLGRLATRLAEEVDEAQEGPALRRQAEALLTAGSIPRNASEVEVPDPTAPDRKLRVRLDPQRGFGNNVARLFTRARRLERALPLRQQKLAAARRLVEALGSIGGTIEPDVIAQQALPSEARPTPLERPIRELAELGRGLEPSLAQRWRRLRQAAAEAAAQITRPIDRSGFESRRPRARSTHASAQSRARAARRGSPPAAGGFHPRRFELPGGWLVLVARSRRENDVLTHRIAAPRDLWFHAQGVTGSHVILRRGRRPDNPSRAVLETTAAIAAYYSKARTSGMAPVIYTEKRYVRKPRKAPPGLVVCLREKTLMVAPQLPAGAARDETPDSQ